MCPKWLKQMNLSALIRPSITWICSLKKKKELKKGILQRSSAFIFPLLENVATKKQKKNMSMMFQFSSRFELMSRKTHIYQGWNNRAPNFLKFWDYFFRSVRCDPEAYRDTQRSSKWTAKEQKSLTQSPMGLHNLNSVHFTNRSWTEYFCFYFQLSSFWSSPWSVKHTVLLTA